MATYANVVRRALIKHGITLRDKSASQKAALINGRRSHPTRGLPRSEDTKHKIGKAVKSKWDSIGEAERILRSQAAQARWNSMTDEKREEILKAASKALRKTTKEGSRLEKYILLHLRLRGYYIIFHKRRLLSSEALHVDLYLPELKTAIEIDGPSHSLPIFGEAKLASNILSDNTKTGLLINGGYNIIRIKNISKSHSEVRYAHILKALLNVIENIEYDNPQEIIIGDKDGNI